MILRSSLAALTLLLLGTNSQEQQSKSSQPTVRSCTNSEPQPAPNKKAGRNKPAKDQEAVGASPSFCSDIHARALEVQERLQGLLRDLRWRLEDEDADEEVFRFSLQLSQHELLADTNPEAAARLVQWTGGKVVVLVKTFEEREGYTRTTVTGFFKGYGESEDKFATRKNVWTLNSNGRLEKDLLDRLISRFVGDR
jgi:hypothetical protein